jgi:hypothetical protein
MWCRKFSGMGILFRKRIHQSFLNADVQIVFAQDEGDTRYIMRKLIVENENGVLPLT